MCGASSQAKNIAEQSSSLGTTLQGNYANNYGIQQNIIGNIRSALNPIVQAGPNQTGFSKAESAAINTNAIDTAGQQAKSLQQQINTQASGRGGGTGLKTGATTALDTGANQLVANNLATSENAATEASYAQGNENYNAAVGGLNSLAGTLNPNEYGGLATSAGGQAFGEANANDQAAAQEFGEIAGGIGAIAGSAAKAVAA